MSGKGEENIILSRINGSLPIFRQCYNCHDHGETEELQNRELMYTGVPTREYSGGRDEKPWQRVIYEVTRKGTHLYEPVKSIPCPLLIVLLGVYLLLGYLTQLVEDEMPRVVKEAEIARDTFDTFSEEAAWGYLNTIMGDQPRVSGTKYHLQKTQDLKALVDSVAAQASLPVRTDWQMVSDDYWLAFAIPHVNVYQNVSNVIALLEGESGFHSNGTIGTSLLLNCHYDSVPYALGASDNAIFCAVMMETLSKLSRRQRKFKHNIIFLFNGAEENPLQASHAFLKHPWSRGVTNVVNLDAAGMNGKPIVFQVTDPRLLNVYQRTVSRPSGQSIGEFLFMTGIIPSDTDFRIWRDFGKFHGLDIAFIKWAHVYHTRYDHPDMVLPGVIQNAGNMMINLVAELADTEELNTQIEPSAAVYYDYLNWFLVTYSYPAAVAVDLLVAVFALLSVAYYVWMVGPRWSTVKELLYSVVGRIVSMLAGMLVCAIFVPLMVATTTQLRYLSEAWIVVPLYWLPFVLTAVFTSQALDAWRTKKCGLNRSIRALQAMAATRLILAVLLLILTCVPSLITMRYLFTVPLFIISLMSLVSLTVVRYATLQAWQHLIMEVLFSLPSTMFVMSLALRFCAILLPTMGRNGANSPDYTIALISVGLAAIVTSTVSGIELLFSRKRLWAVGAPLGLACAVCMFVPFSPYRDDGPSVQRHYWFHSDIITYDYNNVQTSRVSGVLVTKHDAYTPDSVLPALDAAGIRLSRRTDFDQDCETYVQCNLPLFRVRFKVQLNEGLFLYTGPPAPFTPESSTRVQSRSCVGETCTFHFVMTGPAHNLLSIWPRPNVTLSSWTLSSPPLPSIRHRDRPVYIMVHSTPTYSEVFAPLQFNVTFVVPFSHQSQPIVDVSHHAHKINHPEDYTSEYRNLVNAMPKYFNIASNLSFRRNYVF